MQASELVKILQEKIKECGDLEVVMETEDEEDGIQLYRRLRKVNTGHPYLGSKWYIELEGGY